MTYRSAHVMVFLSMLACASTAPEPPRAPSRDVCSLHWYDGEQPRLHCYRTHRECETARALIWTAPAQPEGVGRCVDGETVVGGYRSLISDR